MHVNIITSKPKSGLSVSANLLIEALNKSKPKVKYSIFYVHENIRDIKFSQINIFVGNPDLVSFFIKKNLFAFLTGMNIGYFFWELEKIPLKWKIISFLMNQIWAQTKFIYKIFSKYNKNTYRMPLYFPKIKNNSKNSILISEKIKKQIQGKMVFLNIFDFSSYFQRKNPISTIMIFKKINYENKFLILKSHNGNLYKKEKKIIKNHIKNHKNIIFIDEYINHNEIYKLIDFSNFFISTHKSEGLGLNLLQAMIQGKIVIATNYSGNTDFMNYKNSIMLDFYKIKVNKNEYPYSRNQYWANVNIEQATKKINKLLQNTKMQDGLKLEIQKDIERYTKIDSLINFLNERLNN